ALRVEARELGRSLLGLLEVDRHRERAEPERDLHVRDPVAVVLDVERLDAGHQLRHLRRVVEAVPHNCPRYREVALALDLHASTTSSPWRLADGSSIRSNTRNGGLHESVTIGAPSGRSASWIAAHIAWIAAPPPSPMPFVPSGVNGEADS